MDLKEILKRPDIKERIERYRKEKKELKENWGKEASDSYYRARRHHLEQEMQKINLMIIEALIEEDD